MTEIPTGELSDEEINEAWDKHDNFRAIATAAYAKKGAFDATEFQAAHDDLYTELGMAKAYYQDLKEQLAAKDAEIEERKQDLIDLEEGHKACVADLVSARDAEIKPLRNRLDHSNRAIDGYERDALDTVKQLTAQQQRTLHAEGQVAGLVAALSEIRDKPIGLDTSWCQRKARGTLADLAGTEVADGCA